MAAEARARRREQILQAAFTEFSTNGYDHATMEDIARRAGIGKSTVYEYFPSKVELLTATGDYVLQEIIQDIERMLSPDRPIRSALGDYFEYISSVMGKFSPSFLQIVGDRTVSDVVHNLCARYMNATCEQLQQLLQAAQQSGEVSADINIKTAASIIVTMPNPPFVRMLTKGQLRASLDHLIDLLFRGLSPRQ